MLDVRTIVPSLEPLRGRIESISAKKPWCTVSHIMVTSLRSKWAAGKGSVSAGRRIRVSASQETRFRNVWHGRDALHISINLRIALFFWMLYFGGEWNHSSLM